MSMFIACTSTGTLPTACTASVWKRTPFSWQILPISAIGWMTPISLLANMIETRIVFSGPSVTMARFRSSRSISPSAITGRYVTRKPCFSSFLQVSRMALCSVTWVMM